MFLRCSAARLLSLSLSLSLLLFSHLDTIHSTARRSISFQFISFHAVFQEYERPSLPPSPATRETTVLVSIDFFQKKSVDRTYQHAPSGVRRLR